MTCRNCGTEIADKALICYRCGTATAEPVFKPKVRTPARGWLTWIAVLALLAVTLWLVFNRVDGLSR
jgi:hypothetical protein